MKKLFTKKATKENNVELFITYYKNNKYHHITLWCSEETAKDDCLTDLLIIKLQGLFSVINLETIDVMTQNGQDVQENIWNDFFGYTKDVKEVLVCM